MDTAIYVIQPMPKPLHSPLVCRKYFSKSPVMAYIEFEETPNKNIGIISFNCFLTFPLNTFFKQMSLKSLRRPLKILSLEGLSFNAFYQLYLCFNKLNK